MKNWKVRVKLLMGFGIMAVFALVIGFVSLFLIRDMTTRASEIHEFIAAVGSLDELKLNCEKLQSDLFRLTLYSGDAAVADGIIREAEGYITSIEGALAEYAASAYDETEEANFYSSKDIFEAQFLPHVRGVHAIAQETRDEGAVLSAVEGGEAIYADLEAALDATIEQNVAWSWDDLAATEKSGGTSILIQVIVMVLAFAAAVVFALYIASLICAPLGVITAFVKRAGTTGDVSMSREDEENVRNLAGVKDEIGQLTSSLSQFVGRLTTVTEALKTVADGDLSREVELLSERDLMGHSLETMVYSLNDIFSEVSQATEFVASGSKQIADGAQNLAQASTEQAATVEDLSGKIAQVAKQTEDNAGLAEQAAQLAGTIMANAEKGSTQMNDMMAAVNEIAEASQRISKVMKIIDDIAFQTNILALNASVEAARAGQHGSGFAVVAGEVRTLAVKSADAARDTGELIVSSMEKAELGSRLAGETAASLAQIVSGIGESNRIAGDIATSSKAQATDIEQIHRGVEQVAQVVQQNSATAEQSAAAAQEMNGQSETLKGLVARFALKNDAPRVALPR